MRTTTIVGVVFFATLSQSLGASTGTDTLVVKDGDAYKPAAAVSWSQDAGKITFVLAEGIDAAAFVQLLSERLTGIHATATEGKIVVEGANLNALLDQVSFLSLGGEADPLAALAGLGDAGAAMQKPEGGGSIRASKPMGGAPDGSPPAKNTACKAMATPEAAVPSIAQHDPEERWEAQVVDVQRDSFPGVRLKLKVRRTPKKGPLKKKLWRGRVIETSVVFVSSETGVDFGQHDNQRNLVAYYVAPGDTVAVHAVDASRIEQDETPRLLLDWIERLHRR